MVIFSTIGGGHLLEYELLLDVLRYLLDQLISPFHLGGFFCLSSFNTN